MHTIKDGRAAGFRFAVVVSKYNDFVTDRLQAGALAALAAAGVGAERHHAWSACPGAFEIPLAAQHAAESGRVRRRSSASGCLIRGETPHFEYIASAVSHGLTDGGGGDRRADGVRRADDQLDRGGAGAGGRGHRQQGAGSGGRGDRDGGGRRAADAAGDAEDVSRWHGARKDPRHRAREAALQILYQWEIGKRDVDEAADTFFDLQWPNADAAVRRPARRSRPRWRATRSTRLERDRSR